ncbi:hypothetical protein ACSYAY_06525 [Leptospirillum ferriphilum]|uniref:hypothetical protein n=1 Tax=Leptospirillum ferriphilum TaxID=178606 RepID=UPI003EE72C95
MNKIGVVGAVIGIIGVVFGIWEHYEKAKYQNDLDELLREHNTPHILVEKALTKQWLGDNEPYLTIFLKNRSNEIAKNLKVQFLNLQGKVQKFTPSKAVPNFSISVGENKSLLWPFAPISEIKHIILFSNNQEPSLVGFGFRPLNPFDSKDNIIVSKFHVVRSLPIGIIECSYSSILGAKLEKVFPLFVYISDINS